jgi:putative resolvase
MDGIKARARRLLADPAAVVVAMEHRGRLGTMNIELAEAALSAHGHRLAVLDDDDLVPGMIEVLTSFCSHLHGRRSARNRALKAVGGAQRDVGPLAVLEAGSVPCGGGG